MIGIEAFNLVWETREKFATRNADAAFLADDFWKTVMEISEGEEISIEADVNNERLAKALSILSSRITQQISKNNRKISGLEKNIPDDRSFEDSWQSRSIQLINARTEELRYDRRALREVSKALTD